VEASSDLDTHELSFQGENEMENGNAFRHIILLLENPEAT